MTRSTSEWIGKTDDTPIPPRVRIRVWDRDGGRCQCGCNRKIVAGEKWDTDHTVALANGGENRERNLRTLLAEHHKAKTVRDVALKSQTYKHRLHHQGIKKSKNPMPCGRESKFKKLVGGRVVLRERG